MEHYAQRKLERASFILLVTVHHEGKPEQKIKQESGAGTAVEAVKECRLLASCVRGHVSQVDHADPGETERQVGRPDAQRQE